MSQTQRIIKADNVKLDGQVSLELNSSAGNGRAKAACKGESGAIIIEKNSQYMVVEITCSCGKKTNLRCEFA